MPKVKDLDKDPNLQKKSQDQTMCTSRWGYPLVDFSKNEVRTCCRTRGQRTSVEEMKELGTDLFLNSPYQKERRLEMLKGYRHNSCDSCWKIEDAGMQSARHPNMRTPEGWIDDDNQTDDIAKITSKTKLKNTVSKETLAIEDIDMDATILRSDKPYMLEINLSNVCDLQCSYCSPYFSSQWEKDMELFSLGTGNYHYSEDHAEYIKNDIRKEPSDEFWELFWDWFQGDPIKSLKRIGVIGGEPLFNKKMPEFIDRLIDSYKKIPLEDRPNCEYNDENGKYINDHKPLIWFVTNLNTPKPVMDNFINKQLPRLLEVFRVEIHASLESVGKRIEYTRMNLSWQRYKENAERLCALDYKDFHFGFQIAINCLSVSTLPEFLKYAKYLHDKYERPIILKQNMVSEPEFHHPAILPREFATYVEEAMLFLEDIKDDMRFVHDIWGSWPYYYDYLKTIHSSITEQHSRNISWRLGNLDNVHALFYDYFSAYDKRHNKNFIETFPEYKRFFEYCRGVSNRLQRNVS